MGRSSELYAEQMALEERCRDNADELLKQLKGLLGFAKFVIDAIDLDTEETKVVLRNKGEAVAEVPLSLILANSAAVIAKCEGRE